jgi:hypothetical protein
LCIVAGVLVDIDHIVDIRLNRERSFESAEAKYRMEDGSSFFTELKLLLFCAGSHLYFHSCCFPQLVISVTW